MKRLLTIALMAIAAISAQAQQEIYETEMAVLDARGETLIKEYRELMKSDPKGEKATTQKRVTQLSAMLTGNPYFQIHPYTSEEEIYKALNEAIDFPMT